MREIFEIVGGRPLNGLVKVSGAKNAALPLLISSILSSGRVTIGNVPDLDDIAATIRLLRSLGAHVEQRGDVVTISTPRIESTVAPYSAVKAMRASFWALGPLLARAGEARVALPGGDAIGGRPVDIHLKGLQQMGADVRMQHGVIVARAPGGLRPVRVVMHYPSVGATHHLMMTAALIPGETVLDGAAREPEIVQVAEFLTKMGARVDGAGTSTVTIHGQQVLGDAEVRVQGDRIEAATFLIAGAMTKGDVAITGLSNDQFDLPLSETQNPLSECLRILKAAECDVVVDADQIRVRGPQRLKAVSFETAPYPGLATDIQPLLMAAMTIASGECVVTETVFDNRYVHVPEYRRLGADIRIDGRIAIVSGRDFLSGAPVDGSDIRAAAGLVLMALAAQGRSEVHEIHHIDRGYELFSEKFKTLGAGLTRAPTQEQRELIVGC